jgi:hypothetical protein
MDVYGEDDSSSPTGLVVLKNEIKQMLSGSLHHTEKLKRLVNASSVNSRKVRNAHFLICEALVDSIPLIADNPKHFINFLNYFEESNWFKPGNLELSVLLANFLIELVSANGCFLAASIKLLVHNFWYATDINTNVSSVEKREVTGRNGRINMEQHSNVGIVLHVTIYTLFEYVPLGKQILLPIIRKRFPHQSIDIKSQANYFTHILHMTRYFKEDLRSILNLVVERMIKLDVEIIVDDAFSSDDDEGMEEDEEKGQNLELQKIRSEEDIMFSMEEDDNDKFVNNYSNNNLKPNLGHNSNHKNTKCKAMMVDKTAEILDVMMEIFIQYLKHDLETSKSDREKTRMYVILQEIFEKTIIVTHRSKYVQFIIFWVGSLNISFAKSILSALFKKLENPAVHLYERRTCAAYIASFVSRAEYLDFPVVLYVLHQFVTLAKVYINSLNNSNKKKSNFYTKSDANNNDIAMHALVGNYTNENNGQMNVKKHEIFYCLCQSAFYILAFRGYESKQNEDQRRELQALKWGAILQNNPLEPLKYCLTSVSAEFLKIARVLGLMNDAWINYMETRLAWFEENNVASNVNNDNGDGYKNKNNNKRILNSARDVPKTPMRKRRRLNKASSFDDEEEGEIEDSSNNISGDHTAGSTNSTVEIRYIQCTKDNCKKWRTIPVDIWEQYYKNHPAKFCCYQNNWNTKFDNCSTPEEPGAETRGNGGNQEKDCNNAYNQVEYEENPLDSFFPFDPCCLRRTLKYIDPCYRGWSDIDNKPIANDKHEEYNPQNAISIPTPKRDRLKSYDPFSWDSSFSAVEAGSNLSNDYDHDSGFHDVVYSGVSMSPDSDTLRKNRLVKMHENGGMTRGKRALSQVSSHGSW